MAQGDGHWDEEGWPAYRTTIINWRCLFIFAAYHIYSNSSHQEQGQILSVKYEDGRWSKPYYDCGGGNIWMLTYTVPFFGYDHGNESYFYM